MPTKTNELVIAVKLSNELAIKLTRLADNKEITIEKYARQVLAQHVIDQANK
jgi:predicted transcriptional regulator